VIVAAAIVVANRKAMLSREEAVTEILMPGDEGNHVQKRGRQMPAEGKKAAPNMPAWRELIPPG
jgi:hypothetical protein